MRLRSAQRFDFATKTAGLKCLLYEHRHFVDVERLVGVVVGAELHGLDSAFDGRIGRQHDDEDVGIDVLDATQHAEAVGVRKPIVK